MGGWREEGEGQFFFPLELYLSLFLFNPESIVLILYHVVPCAFVLGLTLSVGFVIVKFVKYSKGVLAKRDFS